jgi:regulatory protein
MSEPARDERAEAISAAMASLARRALSRAELDAKLRARGFSDDIVAAVIARLEELKLIDDRALAERVARRRFESGRAGRFRVRTELRRRGLPEEILEDAVASSVPPELERASASTELERFLRSRARRRDTRKETRETARAAAFRHLIARGFPAALVRDLLGVSL